MARPAQYVGPHKVALVSEEVQKTPRGADIVKVTYDADNVFSEIMPKHVFERLVTEEPTDFNSLRERRYKPVVEALATICVEEDIKFMDLAHVAKLLVNKLEDAFERASSYLWTGDPRAWVSGIDYRGDLSLLLAEKVLRGIPSDESTPAKSEGA